MGQPQNSHGGFATECHRLRHCSAPTGTKEATTTLHVLALLRDLLPCFPAAVVKTCCETLLRVMTLSHVVSVPMPGIARAAPLLLGWALEGLEAPQLLAGSLEIQDVNVEEPGAAGTSWPPCRERGRPKVGHGCNSAGLPRAKRALGWGDTGCKADSLLLTPCLLQLVTACAMQAFHSLFSAQASVACLPAELNAQIITVSLGRQCGEGQAWQCHGIHPPSASPGPLRLRAQHE